MWQFLGNTGNKSRSVHNLTSNNNNTDQGFYQNLSVYRAQNQSQPNLGEKYAIVNLTVAFL
jgi:afadin